MPPVCRTHASAGVRLDSLGAGAQCASARSFRSLSERCESKRTLSPCQSCAVFIKICGIRDVATAAACVALDVDAIGFVFADGSVRQITADAVGEIVATVPASIETVGVFTDAPIESVIDDVTRAGLHTAQLHGPRPVAEIELLLTAGFRVIVARRASEIDDSLAAVLAAHPSIRVLVDGDVPGSGTAFSVDVIDPAVLPTEWILAGGLDAANVSSRIRALQPTGVDVSSGVESARGVKSVEKIEQFVVAVRSGA